MVYNGTKSGLIGIVWIHGFAFLTTKAYFQFMRAETFRSGIDIGKMFLNIILHDDVDLCQLWIKSVSLGYGCFELA